VGWNLSVSGSTDGTSSQPSHVATFRRDRGFFTNDLTDRHLRLTRSSPHFPALGSSVIFLSVLARHLDTVEVWGSSPHGPTISLSAPSCDFLPVLPFFVTPVTTRVTIGSFFPDSLYNKLQARAKRQHRSVAQEVTHLLSEALESRKPLSILDLKGLGKEHWRGVEPSKHAERERASWD
jgi:hypothetical protein